LKIAHCRLPIDKVAGDFWVMLEAEAISQTIANQQTTIVNRQSSIPSADGFRAITHRA
jgi:hypothetical protein